MIKNFKEKVSSFFGKTFQNRSTRQIVGFAVIAVVVVAVLITGIASGIAKVFQNDTEKKSGTKTTNELTSTGVIDTKEVNINSKLPGRILKVYVEEGKEVKAGDIIAEISSDEIQAKKDQATKLAEAAKAAVDVQKAQTAGAQAQADKAANGARPEEIAQAQAAYDLAVKTRQDVEELYKSAREQVLAKKAAAQSQSEKAQNGARAQEIAEAQTAYDLYAKTYERLQKLYEKGAVPAQKVDEIKAQLDMTSQKLSMAKEGAREEDKKAAQALVDEAQAGLQQVDDTFALKREEAQAQVDIRWQMLCLAKQGARPEDKRAAQSLVTQSQEAEAAKHAQYEQALAGIEEADAYLKDATIVAPMDGVITSITAHEGELVSTGMSIAKISDLSSASVEVKVKETDLQKVSVGQSVDVKVSAYANKVFTGKVVTVNQKPDFATKRSTNDNGDFDVLSFGVKIELDNNDKALHPGMTAFVQFKK